MSLLKTPNALHGVLQAHLAKPLPVTALNALNSRLRLLLPLSLLEQALIHPSYYNLPGASTNFQTEKQHNESLATVGNALIGCVTAEVITRRLPHLPTRSTKAATSMFVGPTRLANISEQWGIADGGLVTQLATQIGKPKLREMSRAERSYGHLVEGRGGAREPNFDMKNGAKVDGLVKYYHHLPGLETPSAKQIDYRQVLASVPRAIVGAIHQEHSFAAARNFIHSQLLGPLLANSISQVAENIVPLVKFNNPDITLKSHLAKLGHSRQLYNLESESGRLTNQSVYVVGVYEPMVRDGEEQLGQKIGEGFGSSIKMAKYRAAEDALRRIYLAQPSNSTSWPSDQWVEGTVRFEGMPLGDTEVMEESRQ